MAKELQVIDNYIIFTDTVSGLVGEYALTKSVYRETNESFIIKETIDTGQLVILKSEVIAGDWVDGVGTPYDLTTLLTFLRQNTGFNTAGGGSPAALPDPSLGFFAIWNGTAYEYYNGLQTAINATPNGGTLIQLTSLTLSGINGNTTVLSKDMTWDMNGHFYRYDFNSTTIPLLELAGSKLTLKNGTIAKDITSGFPQQTGAVISASTSTLILDNVTVKSQSVWGVYLNGSTMYGGLIRGWGGIACQLGNSVIDSAIVNTDTGEAGFGGSGDGIQFINTTSIAKNCSVVSRGTGLALYTGSQVINCHSVSTTSFGILLSLGAMADNCYGQGDFGRGISLGNNSEAINCTGRSQTGIGIFCENSKVVNSVGISDVNWGITAQTGAEMVKCTGISGTSYAYRNSISGNPATLTDCVAISESFAAVYHSQNVSRVTYQNLTAISKLSSGGIGEVGSAFFVFSSALGQSLEIMGGYFEVADATKNCLACNIAGVNVKYGKNTFRNATTPVSANIVQALINTEDSQGNIII